MIGLRDQLKHHVTIPRASTHNTRERLSKSCDGMANDERS